MKTLRIWLLATLLGLALPQLGHTQGSLIWNRSFTNSEGDLGIFTQATFWLDYNNTNPPAGYFEPLFNQISFGTNDVGRTFTISSTSGNTNFAAVVNELTNGIDQSMAFGLGVRNATNGVGAGYSYLESQLFVGVGTGPDLIGYQIQSFGLHIDSLSFQTPGSNPNGDGNWTDWSEQVTLSIYGIQVPEPSSAAVMLVGGGILLYLQRRRR